MCVVTHVCNYLNLLDIIKSSSFWSNFKKKATQAQQLTSILNRFNKFSAALIFPLQYHTCHQSLWTVYYPRKMYKMGIALFTKNSFINDKRPVRIVGLLQRLLFVNKKIRNSQCSGFPKNSCEFPKSSCQDSMHGSFYKI